MTFGFLILLGLAIAGHFWLTDRNHRRATNAHQSTVGAHRLELLGLLERMGREREEHREEVQMLCQRIQAPEVAVVQHQIETAGEAGAVMPLNDVESAQREQAERLHRMIEELEAAEAVA